jgi:hypothetical protein
MKKYYLYLTTVLFSACFPQARMTITNVNDVSNLGNSSCLYALPLSGFAVTVIARHESFIPGPFCMYAAKYLGITGAGMKPYEKWSMADMQISQYKEADPDFIYNISGIKNSSFSGLLKELYNDSLILLPVNFATRQVFAGKQDVSSGPLTFTDLSVKRNFEAGKDIVISETLPDSTHVKPSVSKDKNEPVIKTTEQKAEEAANFILKIRKRRFKLISGQYDFMPDGEALGKAVEELNQIESEYISLFTGKINISDGVKTYHFIPENHSEASRTILFRFSSEEGFLDAGEASGKPVLIDIQDMDKTKGLDALKINAATAENQLFYRIPDQAFTRVLFGEQILEEAFYPVYQFGTLVSVTVPGRSGSRQRQ